MTLATLGFGAVLHTRLGDDLAGELFMTRLEVVSLLLHKSPLEVARPELRMRSRADGQGLWSR